MKCNQPPSGFELVSPCPFPTTITFTPWAHPCTTLSRRFLYQLLRPKLNQKSSQQIHSSANIFKPTSLELTAISVKVFNAVLLNCIRYEVGKILKKIRMVLVEINPQHYRFWQTIEFGKKYVQNIPMLHYCLLISPRHLILYTEKRWNKYF